MLGGVLEPIVLTYELRCSPSRAFHIYLDRIGEWWDGKYSRDAATLVTARIEPHADGRVYAQHLDGEDEWGRVTAYEPGERLAYSSVLAQPPEDPSEITVTFARAGSDGCAMRFEHGGWHEGNIEHRSKFREWRTLLDRFAALANGA